MKRREDCNKPQTLDAKKIGANVENGSSIMFLSGDRILARVKEICNNTESVLQIAVSYWGQGSLELTGLQDRINQYPDSVEVICDLDSPGCNPEPIQQLIASSVRVRTLNNLHAKVWICGDEVIVGSANVSLYGLGFDSEEAFRTKVEAAVSIQRRGFAYDVQNWFQSLWKNSDEIEPDRMRLALKRRRERNEVIRSVPAFTQPLESRKRKEEDLPKDRKARYRAFFTSLLQDLREKGYPLGRNLNAKAENRLNIGAGHNRISYFARFANEGRVCVELFIGTQNQQWNKRKFDEIHRQKMTLREIWKRP